MKRLLLAAGLVGIVLYVVDYVSVRLQGQKGLGTVQVSHYYAVPQKNNRVEFYYGDSAAEECVHSLFPHLGDNPCWYVNRHKEERIDE